MQSFSLYFIVASVSYYEALIKRYLIEDIAVLFVIIIMSWNLIMAKKLKKKYKAMRNKSDSE